jgi:hypothetical protein
MFQMIIEGMTTIAPIKAQGPGTSPKKIKTHTGQMIGSSMGIRTNSIEVTLGTAKE